jgi:hypothetical protein
VAVQSFATRTVVKLCKESAMDRGWLEVLTVRDWLTCETGGTEGCTQILVFIFQCWVCKKFLTAASWQYIMDELWS